MDNKIYSFKRWINILVKECYSAAAAAAKIVVVAVVEFYFSYLVSHAK